MPSCLLNLGRLRGGSGRCRLRGAVEAAAELERFGRKCHMACHDFCATDLIL